MGTKRKAKSKSKKANKQSLYAVIHITRQEIWGDNREPYEQTMNNFYGVTSSSDLSYREKLDFIDRLKAIRDGKPQPSINRRNGLWASKAQINKIDALTGVMGWQNDQRLNGFIQRQTNKRKTKWMITEPEATKVIIGLQKMIAGKNGRLYSFLNTAGAQLISSEEGRTHINELRN